jgi:hypothetical protein
MNNINNINVNNRSPTGQSGAGGWVSIHEMTLTLDVIASSPKNFCATKAYEPNNVN